MVVVYPDMSTVTPVVYSVPPPCVPLEVVENLSGWPEAAYQSKKNVDPSVNVNVGVRTPSI